MRNLIIYIIFAHLLLTISCLVEAKGSSSIEYTLPESIVNVTVHWDTYRINADSGNGSSNYCLVNNYNDILVSTKEIAPSNRRVQILLNKPYLSNLSTSIEIGEDGLLKSGSYISTGQTGNIIKSLANLIGSSSLLVSTSEIDQKNPCSDENITSAKSHYKGHVKGATDSITKEIEELSVAIIEQQNLIKENLTKLTIDGTKNNVESTRSRIDFSQSLIDVLTTERNAKLILRNSFALSDPNSTSSSLNIKLNLDDLATLRYQTAINNQNQGSSLLVIPPNDRTQENELNAHYSHKQLKHTFGKGIIFLTNDGQYQEEAKTGIVLVRIENIDVDKNTNKKIRGHYSNRLPIKESNRLLFPKKHSQLFQLFTVSLDEDNSGTIFNVDAKQELILKNWETIDEPFSLDIFSANGPFNHVDMSKQTFGENNINYITDNGILKKIIYKSKSSLSDSLSSANNAFTSYKDALVSTKEIIDAKKDVTLAEINSKKEILNEKIALLTSETNFDYAKLTNEEALRLKILTGEIALLKKEKEHIDLTVTIEFAEQLKRLSKEKELLTGKKVISIEELALINAEIALKLAQKTRTHKLISE